LIYDDFKNTNRKSEMKPGDIIEVSKYECGKYCKREFIAMTSDNRFLCWNENKNSASAWEYGRDIDKLKELKECEALGAQFEYFNSARQEWVAKDKPVWSKFTKYRIKSNISPEEFKKHSKEIIAWWGGAKIQYYNNPKTKWSAANLPLWSINVKYRIKPKKAKTIHEFLYRADISKEFVLSSYPRTLKYIKENFKNNGYILTGRSWKLPD
jgi:hypothetical protein